MCSLTQRIALPFVMIIRYDYAYDFVMITAGNDFVITGRRVMTKSHIIHRHHQITLESAIFGTHNLTILHTYTKRR